MNAKITEGLMYKAGMERRPISGTFELTPMCNFSCKMCYIRKDKYEVVSKGGLKSVAQWIQWAKEARDQGMLYLLITGGEPLSYPGFWDLYEQLAKMGFIISINTNGSLITEDVAQHFAKMPPKKINITLYGASNETYEQLCGVNGGFERVMQGVGFLKQYKIRYKYNCSLTPYNLHELENIYSLAKEQKTAIEIASYMFPPVRRNPGTEKDNIRLTAEEAGYASAKSMEMQLNEEQFLAYARNRIKYETPPVLDESVKTFQKGQSMACRAGRCSFWLDWQGNLSACGMIDTPKYSLERESFCKAWEKVVKSTNNTICLEGCADCKNRELCHACISAAYCETGDINGRPEYICQMISSEAEFCKKKLIELGKRF